MKTREFLSSALEKLLTGFMLRSSIQPRKLKEKKCRTILANVKSAKALEESHRYPVSYGEEAEKPYASLPLWGDLSKVEGILWIHLGPEGGEEDELAYAARKAASMECALD